MEKREGGLEMQCDKPCNMGNTQSLGSGEFKQVGTDRRDCTQD